MSDSQLDQLLKIIHEDEYFFRYGYEFGKHSEADRIKSRIEKIIEYWNEIVKNPNYIQETENAIEKLRKENQQLQEELGYNHSRIDGLHEIIDERNSEIEDSKQKIKKIQKLNNNLLNHDNPILLDVLHEEIKNIVGEKNAQA